MQTITYKAPRRKQSWKLVLNIITLIALGGLIYALREQIMETFDRFDQVNAAVLLLMLATQALNYYSYAHMYQSLFAILGRRVPFRGMLRVLTGLNFVNSVFPSGGVSGFSYFALQMRRYNVTSGKATLVQLMRFILIFVSFQVLLAAGLIMLAFSGSVNNFVLLVAGSLSTLLFVGTFAGAYIIGSKDRINGFFTFLTRLINKLIHVFRTSSPETINIARVQGMFGELHENYLVIKSNPKILRMPVVYALLANIAEVTTIYVVYIAFGEWVNIGAVIIAYAIANFAGLISVLPGGVGVYETLMTAVLASAGVPARISIPVTIMYRILNMLIQIPMGYIVYHRAISNDEL